MIVCDMCFAGDEYQIVGIFAYYRLETNVETQRANAWQPPYPL